MNILKKKIKNKNFKIAVIGLGYVGLPKVLQFIKKGFTVYGFDKDREKYKLLKKNKSYLKHLPLVNYKKYINKFLKLEKDFSKIHEVDVIIICLPTPLNSIKNPDLSFIKENFKEIFPFLKKNQAIILESTSYPGTTREIFVKKINSKFEIGRNFSLIFSPEREEPGRKDISQRNVPKLVSGYSENCLQIAKLVYGFIYKKVIPVKSLELAEMTKIYENVFRAINIGFVNEMKKVSKKLNLDIHEVIKYASTKPYGFMPFSPGPGLGGHCIPIDPFYLSWLAKKNGINTQFIELAGVINRSMPSWVVKQVKSFYKRSFYKKKCLILGVAYKPDVNDCRESPAFEIMKILKKNNVKFDYHDPNVIELPKLRNIKYKTKNILLSKPQLKKYDYVLLITNHRNVNYNLIYENSKLIFDTRNVFNFKSEKIIQC